MHLQVVILAAVACSIAHAASPLESSYAHQISMDQEGNYLMYWTTNDTTQMIDIAVSVKTTGWVGFGFSPYTGRMPGSDTVIGWVSNGTAYLQDRFATTYTTPALDASQDYTLISGEESNGKTILKFRRKYNTTDSKDLPLEAGTSRLIWSYHNTDPVASNSFTKHQKQGSRSVNLFDAIPLADKPPLPNDTRTFNLTNTNILIPAKDTTYWCSSFNLPVVNYTEHIIKIAPYVQKGNEGLVHHILIYDCSLSHHEVGQGHECSSDNMPLGMQYCRGATTLAAWAIGGEAITFPAHAGLPMGGSSGSKNVLMEVHYDNPNLTPGLRDSSGMTFYYTNQRRTYDIGVLEVGRVVSELTLIPERQSNWQVAGYCTKSCTQNNLPATGINVFAGLLHTHLAGRAISVKQIRNGVEMSPFASNPHYDFNYQETTYFKKDKKILPNDQLTVICTYNTLNRANYTVGGIATKDEMCLGYFFYYPKQKLSLCMSTEARSDYTNLVAAAEKNKRRVTGKDLKELVNIENTVQPLQYCAAKNHVLLQSREELRITDFVRQKTNVALSGGIQAHTYSTMLIIVTTLITYLIIDRT